MHFSHKRPMTALSMIGLMLLASPSVAMGVADWPQWRGPNRDGVVSDASVPRAWPKTLTQQWKVTVGVGHSSPVVMNNRIYIFARQGEEEVLLCLDSATGKEIWRSGQPIAYEMHRAASAHGKGPKSTPVLNNGKVCTLGITGVLSCHDARTGKLKWRREFSKQYPNTSPLFGTAMSPLVLNGQLIAHVGGHDKGALIAFDAETGAIKWSNETDGPAYSSPIVVNLAGTLQVVTFMQKDFVGVDGKEREFVPQSPPGQPVPKGKRTANWLPNGNGIVVNEVTTAETPKGTVTSQLTRKWTLSNGELVIDMYIDNPNGSFETKRIFTKK